MNIESKVKNIIAAQLNIPVDAVINQACLSKELGADSLDTVEIIMAMEEEFKKEFQDNNIKIETVQDVIDFIGQSMKNDSNGMTIL
jgi:acyl carrier protein